ncbi:MAG: response regulator [Pseudomonadota bacterium]
MGFRGVKNTNIFPWLLALLGLFFWITTLGFEYQARRQAEAAIRDNALVISDALWNYNYQGASDYLALTAKTQRYNRLVVRDDSGKVFQFILSQGRGRLDDFLKKIKLVPLVKLSAPVVRDGRVIGEISADWESGTVYFALYAFFALVLIAVALNLYARVLRSKIELEDRVRARTEELFQSNTSLKQEILERKQAEGALRQSEEILRATWESIEYGILVVAEDGGITHFNSRFAALWSIPEEKIKGGSDEELLGLALPNVADPKGFVTRVAEIYRTNHDSEDLIAFRDGRVLERVSALLRRSDSHRDRVWIFRDITDKKRAEEERNQLQAQLNQSQRMEAVGNLAGGIAHDFNNILQALSGYIQLFQAGINLDEKYNRYLAEMAWAVERASDLVHRLLTFSRKVEPVLKTVDLNQVVEGAVKILERTIPKMIRIHCRLTLDPWTLQADPGQLERVVINLGTNARDAMSEGGELTIETENVVWDESFCRQHVGYQPGKYVLLKVSDTGSGVDQDAGDRIFEPFYTTKGVGVGSGLGLSTVYAIVKGHGGRITFYSQQGMGTTFLVYLPAGGVAEGPAVDEPLEEIRQNAGSGETVLVIDDEEPILGIIRDNLEAFDYRVITAQTGEEGLEIFKVARGMIDLVILDLGMPGMGGRACLKELLARDPAVKVVIVTGYSGLRQAEEMFKAGAKAFVSKPFRLGDMLKKIRETLDDKNVPS